MYVCNICNVCILPLPPPPTTTTGWLLVILADVASQKGVNKMSEQNIGKCSWGKMGLLSLSLSLPDKKKGQPNPPPLFFLCPIISNCGGTEPVWPSGLWSNGRIGDVPKGRPVSTQPAASWAACTTRLMSLEHNLAYKEHYLTLYNQYYDVILPLRQASNIWALIVYKRRLPRFYQCTYQIWW